MLVANITTHINIFIAVRVKNAENKTITKETNTQYFYVPDPTTQTDDHQLCSLCKGTTLFRRVIVWWEAVSQLHSSFSYAAAWRTVKIQT